MSDRKVGIKILGTGRALPKTIVTNDMLSQMVETSDEWIQTRTGIKKRHQCQEESCVSLAIDAAKKALAKSKSEICDIGLIIVASTTPDYIFPSAACLVSKALGLDEEVMAFDLSSACTGFVLGLTTAYSLLQNMTRKCAIVIGSEQLSRIIDYTDRNTCILFGDGAGAAVITLQESLYVSKSWSRGNLEALSCLGAGNDKAYINMKGNDVFKFAVNAMEQAMEEVLEESGHSMEEIDFVVCHQANERIIRLVQKKYKGYEDKFYINIDKYGNTSAASIAIALDELMESGKLKKGHKILCAGFGAGLTWSGALIEI